MLEEGKQQALKGKFQKVLIQHARNRRVATYKNVKK